MKQGLALAKAGDLDGALPKLEAALRADDQTHGSSPEKARRKRSKLWNNLGAVLMRLAESKVTAAEEPGTDQADKEAAIDAAVLLLSRAVPSFDEARRLALWNGAAGTNRKAAHQELLRLREMAQAWMGGGSGGSSNSAGGGGVCAAHVHETLEDPAARQACVGGADVPYVEGLQDAEARAYIDDLSGREPGVVGGTIPEVRVHIPEAVGGVVTYPVARELRRPRRPRRP